MYKKSDLTLFILAGLLIATGGFTHAQAQSSAATNAPLSVDALEEVVVTARRTSERQQDVPIAITAFTNEDLAKRNIVGLGSLNNVAPGLTIEPANAPTTLIITIRGLGNTNPNTGSDATVGLYMNDVPINIQNGTNIGLFDMQNVQVLKGPQGTLFGRNTTGGALLLNENKPTDKFEGYVQGGGTFFRVGEGGQLESVINIPLSPTLALRAGISAVDRDGFVRNVLPRDAPAATYGSVPLPYGRTDFENLLPEISQAWRMSLRWTPFENFENLTFYDGAHYVGTGLPTFATALNPTGSIVNFAPFLGFPNPTAAYASLVAAQKNYYWSTMSVGDTPDTTRSETLSNTSILNLSDTLNLKNIVGYRYVTEQYAQDITGLPGAYYLYQQITGGYDLSDEMQLQGRSVNDRVKWVGGLFYFQESRKNISDRTVQFGGIGPNTDYHAYAQSYSAFAQATGKVTDKFSITAGLRGNIDDRQAKLSRYLPDVTGAPVSCTFAGRALSDCLLQGSKNFNAVTWTATADYKIDSETLIYLDASKGYRSGGFSATQSTVTEGFTPFQPETVLNYELGLKRDWHLGGDALLRTNFAIYHQDYSDIQRLAVDPNDFTNQIIINAPKATVNGGELEIILQPIRGVKITYGYAHVDPKYGNFVVGGANYSNRDFCYAPHDTHTASAAYTLPISETIGEVSLTVDFHHQNSMFYDDLIQSTAGGAYPASTLTVPGYSTYGLRMGWKGIMASRYDLDIFGTNLGNAKILPNGSPSTYPTLGNGIGFYALPPLMAGFNVRYNFGH